MKKGANVARKRNLDVKHCTCKTRNSIVWDSGIHAGKQNDKECHGNQESVEVEFGSLKIGEDNIGTDADEKRMNEFDNECEFNSECGDIGSLPDLLCGDEFTVASSNELAMCSKESDNESDDEFDDNGFGDELLAVSSILSVEEFGDTSVEESDNDVSGEELTDSSMQGDVCFRHNEKQIHPLPHVVSGDLPLL